MSWWRGPRGLGVVAVLVVSTAAQAQPATDAFGIERFRLAMDRAGVLDVESAEVAGHLSVSASAFVGFAHDPLVVYDQDMNAVDALVDRRLTTGLGGSLGLWNRLELGVALDVVGYQRGTDDSPTMKALPAAGLGDVRVATKVALVRGDRMQLALVPALVVPLGSASGYLREAGVTFVPAVAVSATRGRIRGAANVGYVVRSRVETAGLVIDDEALARAGIGARIGRPADPLGELWWSTSLAAPPRDRASNQIAVEMLVGGTWRASPAVAVFAAAGLGLDNGFGTPDWRGLAGVRVDGMRGVADRDSDGIVDTADRCAAEREDVDGFGDTDGCPDPDNDGDGIHDTADRCPNEAEDKDSVADDDGCPDPKVRLAGRVVDPQGRAIARATIGVRPTEPAGPTVELVTDDDGRFATEVERGTVEITTRAPGYQPTTALARPGTGDGADVAVTLTRAVRQGQLRGQVLSFGGKPVTATVTVGGAATATTVDLRASAHTDAEGRFTFDLPAGSFAVTIEAAGHVTQQRTVTVKLDGVTVLNVDLRDTK